MNSDQERWTLFVSLNTNIAQADAVAWYWRHGTEGSAITTSATGFRSLVECVTNARVHGLQHAPNDIENFAGWLRVAKCLNPTGEVSDISSVL